VARETRKKTKKLVEAQPRFDLTYTSREVACPAGDVFWYALSVANWDGVMQIDFSNLTVSYPVFPRKDTPGYAVSLTCIPISREITTLNVHVHQTSPAEEFSARSNVDAESDVINRVVAAIKWSAAEWRKLPLRAEYSPGELPVELKLHSENLAITANGIVVPIRNGTAKLRSTSGPLWIGIHKEEYAPSWLRLYSARADQLPSALVFASMVAPGSMAMPAPLANILANVVVLPPPIPVPIPVPPGLPPGAPVAPAAPGNILVQGVALLVVSYLTAAEILKDLDVSIDIKYIDVNNDTKKRFCCCRWVKTDTLYGPLEPLGKGRYKQASETFQRVFYKTVVKPTATSPCLCGVPPIFGLSIAATENVAVQGRLVQLPAGPPTSGPTASDGVRCGRQGETVPVTLGWRIRNVYLD
jgi:hypothetical protein